MVRLSVITDEIDPSLDRALDVCEELGIDAVELRFLDRVQVIDVGPNDLRNIRATLDRREFAVSAIASPFMKCRRGEHQDEMLSATLRAAEILDAPIVRAFAYWREDDARAALPDAGRTLRAAAERAHAAGVTLALENEHECNVATSAEARAALDVAASPHLRLIWDPGNAAMLDPSAFTGLGGVEEIRERVAHVHVKDVTASREWTRIGDGIVDFAALLRYLDETGYDGYLSFETHYQRDGSGELATRDCVAALRELRRVTLRYGILGAGVVVPLHLEGIAALDDVELVGISAPDGAEALAEVVGTRAFTDNLELLGLGLDVVVVAAPHPFHPALTIEALARGAHVLVEKPLAVEVREADAMIAAAGDAGRLLGVCFQQRFRPVIAAARELITAGRLGELIRVSIVDPLYRPNSYYGTAGWRGTWAGEGGGVLMNQAPHTLDLLCHLAGPPATVWGRARRRSQPMEAEDTATALLEWENGAVGTLAVSTTEPGVQRIELVGDRGRIEIVGETIAFERFEPSVSEHLGTAPGMFDAPDRLSESVELPAGRGDHVDVHTDFAAAVRTGGVPRVPAHDALWSLEVANAIVLSTHTGEAVPLPVDRDAYAALLADLRSGVAAL